MPEARAEVEHTLAEARQKADAIRSESRDQAASERARIIANANQEEARLRSQAIAAAQLKARTLQLEQREILLNSVFEQARQQISGCRKKPGVPGYRNGFTERGPRSAGQLFGAHPGRFHHASPTPTVLDPILKETGVRLELASRYKKVPA